VRDGYEGVSMRRLAEKVGCSHGNLYLHFKDKEALFDSLTRSRSFCAVQGRTGAAKGEPLVGREGPPDHPTPPTVPELTREASVGAP
jgi:AcrR family transcriptional regulator